MNDSLATRSPSPTPEQLTQRLVPPPRFQHASFEGYRPDPQFPSQQAAKDRLVRFAERLGSAQRGGPLRFLRRSASAPARGIYLDGGFGVGKTHLLTALCNTAQTAAAGSTGSGAVYGTFVEYTNLIGVLGYRRAVDLFAGASVVCIDEFELDDVGDTLLMTRMIREISDAGVPVVATSNTLPDALGEGRFAAQDFLREINEMADRFEVMRIDGRDYREKDRPADVPALPETTVLAAAQGDGVTLDAFESLLEHLATVHPSRYGFLIDGVRRAHLTGVRRVVDHHAGLRLVVLIDRLYDREVPLVVSGERPDALFSDELLRSGYRKKYLRCLSRASALAADGQRAI